MTDGPNAKPDFFETAKQQLTQLMADVDHAIDAVKDPERRRQVTESALEKLQSGLARAQDSVAKYQEKVARDKPAPTDPSE
jgi:phage shock protein A